MYIHHQFIKDYLVISYIDKNGNIKFRKYKVDNIYEWEVVHDKRDQTINKQYKNYNGEYVRRIKSNKKQFNKFSLVEFLFHLPKEEQDILFTLNNPKMSFLDIETEITEESHGNIKEYVKQAINKVTAISLVNENHVVDFFSLKRLSIDEQNEISKKINKYQSFQKYTINFHSFSDEKEMLLDFFLNYVKKSTLISGWNVLEFDWQYLTNRALNLGIDIKEISPTKTIDKKNYNIPYHLIIADYLEYFKKWDKKVKIKENFKLDTIAELVLGIKKVSYKGTLKDLYNDFPLYAFYNIIDAVLVQLLHYKLRTIYIPITLASLMKISFYKATSAVTITETLIFNELLKNNLVVSKDVFEKERIKRLYVLNEKAFDKLHRLIEKEQLTENIYKKMHKIKDNVYKTEEEFKDAIKFCISKKEFENYYEFILDKSEEKYQGAYVKEPILGKHKFVASFDFASLYPTTMRQFNISVESFIMKIDRKIVNKMRKSNDFFDKIICSNGAVFSNKDSILKIILTELYKRRKEEKKKMYEYIAKENELKEELKRLKS